jgi:hypothetical protein
MGVLDMVDEIVDMELNSMTYLELAQWAQKALQKHWYDKDISTIRHAYNDMTGEHDVQ